jgi:enterochelin esterase family protein
MKNIPLIRADNGVWSVTVGPFPPGVNRYSYKVDGLTLADPRNSASSESVTFVHSLYEIPGADFLSIKEEAPHGAVQEVMYKSKSLNTIRRMHVYTPPGYGIDDKKYPVFYLIHGGGDSDASWSTVGRAGIILDNLISEGKAKPMLIVMPAGHLTKNFVFSQRSVDSMFRQSELFCEDLINDIIPHMEKHYRIMTGPRHRAVAGLSMGGLHTLYAAIAHPETFGYAGVFSSGFFGENGVENFEKEHADWLENPAKKNIKLFWFATGKGDILVGGNTRSTVDMLKRYGFTPEYTESEGFHDWNNWRMYLYTFVQRLFT